MQYIPNGDTYNLLKKFGNKPDLKIIASIIRDLIRAIYYLHNMVPKIVHRDIKPENILLDENNNAYLIDFGWSNYIINYRRRNSICGTPIYYPPEMLNDEGHDERADIWCIGILLFELTTGSIPFECDDEDTVKQNISELNIIWPDNIDPDVKDLCSKILKLNPNQRPSLEQIYEHKFFKKHLGNNEYDKKLIKPTKFKNKIFVVSRDIPGQNSPEKNKTPKDEYNKNYLLTEKIKRTENNDKIDSKKNNTDSKINIPTRRNTNYNNTYGNHNENIKRRLICSINNDRKLNKNNDRIIKDFNNSIHKKPEICYHKHIRSSQNLNKYCTNLNESTNKNINIDKSFKNSNRKITTYNNLKTEEDKSNNNVYYIPCYKNKKHSDNSLLKFTNNFHYQIPIAPNQNRKNENNKKEVNDRYKGVNNSKKWNTEKKCAYQQRNLNQSHKNLDNIYNCLIYEDNNLKENIKNTRIKYSEKFVTNVFKEKENQIQKYNEDIKIKRENVKINKHDITMVNKENIHMKNRLNQIKNNYYY
jgi:serine/threonine protein kinase